MLNLLGVPNTNDYRLGRGDLMFAPLPASGFGRPTAGYEHLGHALEFTVTVDSETLPHYSSRTGIRTLDKEVILQQAVTLSIVLDELNHQNLARFLSGSAHVLTTADNSSVAGFTYNGWIASLELGRWYDLHNSAGMRAYQVDADNTTLSIGATTLVQDTDYLLDAALGRVFFLTTGPNNVGGGTVDLVVPANAGTSLIHEVRALISSPPNGALKFISENAADGGKREEWQFHRVSLKAEGDLSLLGNEIAQMTLTGVAERNEAASPSSPVLTIRSHSAA